MTLLVGRYEAEAGDKGHGEHDDGHGDASDEAAAPPRSFGQWFRQLNANPYLAVSVVVAMPSGAASISAGLFTSLASCFFAYLLALYTNPSADAMPPQLG